MNPSEMRTMRRGMRKSFETRFVKVTFFEALWMCIGGAAIDADQDISLKRMIRKKGMLHVKHEIDRK
jgi:hypothetical protein